MKYKKILLFFLCLNLIFCASSQKKLEKEREKNPKYQYNLGLFHLNNGNVDEAIKYLNRCLSLNPRYHLAFNALGLSYSMKRNFVESERCFKKCLEIEPALTEAHNNLGIIYMEMGFLDKAKKEFQIAIADKSYNSRELPYFNLARLYLDLNKIQEALNYVTKSIEINSTMAMSLNLKGYILERTNDFKGAINNYKKARKIVPDDVNLGFNLGVAYFKYNEFSKAKEVFEEIYSKTTDLQMKNKIDQYLKLINKNK